MRLLLKGGAALHTTLASVQRRVEGRSSLLGCNVHWDWGAVKLTGGGSPVRQDRRQGQGWRPTASRRQAASPQTQQGGQLPPPLRPTVISNAHSSTAAQQLQCE